MARYKLTNEMMAREIANGKSKVYGPDCNSHVECYESAMAMAELKNKRFVEYMRDVMFDLEHGQIEKVKNLLSDLIINYSE